MAFHFLPKAQGLYRPEFEHDACGIGLYAHMKGEAAHYIVQKGLQLLCQLDHRGGQGSDPASGDGAGIMVQLPHRYFSEKTEYSLPEPGAYGVAMVFFNTQDAQQEELESKINALVEAEGQQVIGWRTVPVDDTHIGTMASDVKPFVRQLFVGIGERTEKGLPFERKLYVIRKQAEQEAKEMHQHLYFASFSSETIVYKGMLTSVQVDQFYLDLQDPLFESAFALVHSRFSTNTFPSWERAHPNRYLIHNGEINTLQGNVNWMRARQKQLVSEAFGADTAKILPILDTDGSDSSIMDNAFEFFVLAGRKPAHAAMMMIPEPWDKNPYMDAEKRAFYAYHSTLMEPWDGPTAISFTNGKQIGAVLDRNGLRPGRYYVTKDDHLILSSEVGVLDVEEENILEKNRISPGKMLLLDMEQGRLIPDEEIKQEMAAEAPYQEWLDNNMVTLEDQTTTDDSAVEDLVTKQRAFGYTYEDVQKYIVPLVSEGKDPIGAMGNDTPLSVLSDRPQSLFNYFKQLFAQVTNPPIDAYREQIVTSTLSYLGKEGNLLHPNEANCRRIKLASPIMTNNQLEQLVAEPSGDFKLQEIHTLFGEDLKKSMQRIFQEAEEAISKGVSVLVLTDRLMSDIYVPVPTLLAVSGLHQHLVRKGLRTKVSLIASAGEVREVHHVATLLGYGADAIHPYLAYATLKESIDNEDIKLTYPEAVKQYAAAMTEGVVKVMSKMGISTVQSYRGAQIFEAVGISHAVISKYFTGTTSQLDGIDLNTIAAEAKKRHQAAYKSAAAALDTGSEFQWRANGEHHAFNPKTIHTLQWACRQNNYNLFKEYTEAADQERLGFLRNLFEFKNANSIPIDEVESVESIVTRFKTGAMSFGSISEEAHEALAIAMNRLGGKSNSGEGGENAKRYQLDENGDSRRSAIKQIASGRFGVMSSYLVQANELQIKVAQGAKPGEGGQLPGKKVYPWVADVRKSTPGVNLISPPPHHDIYSIEDLAQLIHDLKNANRDARISVKLVAKGGVGTIAAGVAKGSADVIVISGYDGGTGASPKTSIKHAGLPWEIGLAEAHQTLMLNGLRDRVRLETDGKLMTGRDVVMAALLGAEEYGFATAPLVVLGCVMMRVCHIDTCPVGIATQNPELRKKFIGDPDHVVNFMTFIAQEVREIMAELGFRNMEEMVGRTDVLEVSERATSHWKAGQLDLSRLLHQIDGARTYTTPQNHKIDIALDTTDILPHMEKALAGKEQVHLELPIRNINRVAGTIAGSEISKKFAEAGLPEDTVNLHFNGSAGQSFGAFTPKGMTLSVTGDANDYVGKGLSGAKLIVKKPVDFRVSAAKHVIAGNVALYGATSGEAYINGMAGERFAVRNSGATAVVEGIGEHGCEYMTGGKVVILGEVGKNFAAGMSGGIAYIHTTDRAAFKQLCNTEMIDFEPLTDKKEIAVLRSMIEKHAAYTDSEKANVILENWEAELASFVKVIPIDYRSMLHQIEEQQERGLTQEEAVMEAFVLKNQQPRPMKESEKTAAVH